MRTLFCALVALLISISCSVASATERHAFYGGSGERFGVSKEEIASAIEVGGGELFRPGAVDELVRVLREEAGLPVSDRQSLADLIRSDAVSVGTCGAYVGQLAGMGYIDSDGKARTDWKRVCRANANGQEEFWLVWHGERGAQAFLSLQCGNAIIATPVPMTQKVEIPACVPLPSELLTWGEDLVLFPHADDVRKWEACNPQAWCDNGCVQWLKGNVPNSGTAWSGIQKVVEQDDYAFMGITMMPNPELEGALAEVAVFCKRGPDNVRTDDYRSMSPSGEVTEGY